MPSIDRRIPAIAVCVLLVLGGCLGAGGQTTDTTTTAATSTTTAPTTSTTTTTSPQTTTDTTHDRWIRGDAVELSPAKIAAETSQNLSNLDANARDVVRRAVENGSTTLTTVREAPGEFHRPVVVDGAYYDLNRTTVSAESVTVHDFKMSGPIREESDEYDRATADAVAFENLSAPDQRVFRVGLPSDERLDEIRFTKLFHFYYENGTPPANATFADGDVHYVAYEGHYFRVKFDETRTVNRTTYRYAAERIASSQEEYTEIALDRYVTNVSNASLSGEPREILIRTLENGSVNYHSEDPSMDGDYVAFYRWTLDHQFVRYEGEYYWLQIYKVME